MAEEATGAGVLAERARRLAAASRVAEPMEWAPALAPLVDRAETIGATDVGNQLRLEIYATGTHAQMAGRPDRAARFASIPPPLREKGIVDLIASWASEASAPPLFRAHEWDLVWSIEESPRKYPRAGLDAAAMYLEYEVLVPDSLFAGAGDSELGRRFKVLDALARAAQLAGQTKNTDLAARVRDRTIVRLKELDGLGAYRYMLELGYALIELEPLAPGGLAVIDALVEPAVAHFNDVGNFHLGRSVLELAVESARAQRRTDGDVLKRRIAESHVVEADYKKAAGGNAMLVAWAIQEAIKAYRGLPDSNERVAELTARLEGANLESLGDLKEIRAEVSIPSEKIEAVIRSVVERPHADALAVIGLQFMENRERAYDLADRVAKTSVIQSLIPKKVLTTYGETIELQPGTPERREHDAMQNVLMGLGVTDQLLAEIFSKLRADGLTVSEIMDALRSCPFFASDALELIESGLERWFEDDNVSAIHLLVPQIEAVLRSLLKALGIPVTRVDEGHVQVKLLDGLLRLAAQSGLPDEIVFTLEAVLTDKGRNVRNRVAHGWIQKSECTPTLAARVVQLLLMLATLGPEEVKD